MPRIRYNLDQTDRRPTEGRLTLFPTLKQRIVATADKSDFGLTDKRNRWVNRTSWKSDCISFGFDRSQPIQDSKQRFFASPFTLSTTRKHSNESQEGGGTVLREQRCCVEFRQEKKKTKKKRRERKNSGGQRRNVNSTIEPVRAYLENISILPPYETINYMTITSIISRLKLEAQYVLLLSISFTVRYHHSTTTSPRLVRRSQYRSRERSVLPTTWLAGGSIAWHRL